MAWKVLATVTVYVRPAAKGADGVKRMVMGSCHSTRPGTTGEMLKIDFGSTVPSSCPATGRSKATETMAVGSAPSAGEDRSTPSWGDGTVAKPARETAAAAARKRI